MDEETAPDRSGDPDGFTYDGRTLSRAAYLGQAGLGPLAEQFIPCPRCKDLIHKFSVRCCHCGVVVREIGKIDAGPRGSAGKGIAFVVGILVFALASMVLGERATHGLTLPSAIGLATGGFVCGVNGLLGALYFRYFVGVTFLRGLTAFAVGILSVLLGIAMLVLLI